MTTRKALPMWTVYARPLDYPDKFVARKWLIDGGPEPKWTDVVLLADTLDELRLTLAQHGLTAIARWPGDEPQIVETWL